MKPRIKLVSGISIALLLMGVVAAGSVLAATSSGSSREAHQDVPLHLEALTGPDYLDLSTVENNAHVSIPKLMRLVHAIADRLGITVADVVTQLRAGNTLAQVIEANGVDAGALFDDLTAGIRANLESQMAGGSLTQEEMHLRLSRLEDLYTRIINSGPPAHRRDKLGGLHHFGDAPAGHHRGVLREAIKDLGLDMDEVLAQLRAGKTPAQIIEANGGSVDAALDALTARVKARAENAVASGRISQEEMDHWLVRLRAWLLDLFQRPLPLAGTAGG